MDYRGTRPFRLTVRTSWGELRTSAHRTVDLARRTLHRSSKWGVVWHADAAPFRDANVGKVR